MTKLASMALDDDALVNEPRKKSSQVLVGPSHGDFRLFTHEVLSLDPRQQKTPLVLNARPRDVNFNSLLSISPDKISTNVLMRVL